METLLGIHVQKKVTKKAAAVQNTMSEYFQAHYFALPAPFQPFKSFGIERTSRS
jgi:hypothetical protein